MMIENLKTIIVNWNLKEDTVECIDSLIAAGLKPDDIILVDNGSTDGSVEEFEDRYHHQIKILQNPENLGYAQGYNQGINQALTADTEWLFLINNDTQVSEDIFQVFLQSIEDYPQYSIFSPTIFFNEKPDQIWFSGALLIPGTLLTYDKYRNKKYNPQIPGIFPVDFVNGCGMLVNKDVFNRVGLFDTSLVMYGEEVDFCWRARLAGYQFAASSKAFMWHKISLSAKKDLPRTRYLKIRNQVYFYRNYSEGIQILVHFIYSTCRTIYLLFKDIMTSQSHLSKPLIQGWLDGWFKPLDQR